MRKKSILIFFIWTTILMIKGQEYESVISNLNITTPSASGIASKIKSPSALSTGIPEIEIPFFSLATHNKGVSINLGLSYHPNNTFMESKSSDVGLGWSVLGSNNLIYREINTHNGVPTNNYHFNFLGRNGSFQFFKNSLGNLTLSKITENRYKITVIETGPDLYKFKIIDENGISYYFESLDISYYNPNISTNSKQNYTEGYYLTKIEDFNGNELVAFEYQEDNYTVPKSPGSILTIPVKSLKISKIISRDFGSVHFSYTFNSSDRSSYHDSFKLDAVELRNTADKRIEKYVLQSQNSFVGYPYGFISSGPNYGCNYYINQTKRRLEKVLKYGTGTSYETTEIKYSFSGNNFDITDYWTEYPLLGHDKCFTEEFKNPKYLGVALLQSIKYPNGTEVRYTFEPNQYYVDKSFPDYQFYAPPYEVKDRDAQYFEDIAFIPFDYHNTNGLSQFGLFSLPVNPDESDGYSYLFINYHVDEYYTDSPFQPENGNYVVNISFNNGVNGQDGYKKYPPGSNSFVISGTGGRGSITIKRIRYKNLPLENFSTGSGVRIKKIEYLENNTVNEALTRRYNYEMFDGSNATSGFLNDIENEQSVVYKNVKETVGQNKGYSKYYYRTLFDKAEPIQNTNDSLVFVGSEMKYVNLLSNGLFEKKEIFDDHDMLIQKDTVLSTMRSLGSNYIAAGFFYGQPIEAMRNGIIQNQKTISTIYTSSGSYTQISETTRDINDYNIIHQKNLGSDGNITETLITYPWSKRTTDPKLWNANITTVPLSVETKRNGKVVSKAETKYENAVHFYPTSQVSYLPDNLSQSVKNMSYDVYDDKGNPVQYTVFPEVGSTGIPTTIIWGYNKTMPIAKIEGARLSDIPSSLITAIVNASNNDANASAAQEEILEKALVDALNTFKNDNALKNFMVTCYTYNPLIGVTTIIPPNGMMEFYKYDAYNRLQKVVDVNGNTVKEHQYNYKQ